MINVRGHSVGRIILEKGFASEKDIEKALSIQKVTKEPLLKILTDIGVITDEQSAQVLAEQWGLQYVNLLNYPIEKESLRLLNPERARYYGIFVLKKEGGKVYVAISDPTNIEAMDYLRLVLGNNIAFYVSTRATINQAIEKYYEMEDALKQAEEEAGPGPQIIEQEEEMDITKLKQLGEEAPVIRLVNNIISQAIVEGASDIHIEPLENSLRVRYRIDGILYEKQSFPKSIQPGIVSRFKIMSNIDIAEKRIPQDGRISLKFEGRKIDFRVSSLPTVYGEKIVLRILDKSKALMPLEKLGFSAGNLKKFEDMIAQPYGMILISGPTGSGKTTTLYSALHRLNTPTRNIVTVEDPVEYQIRGINQVQVNEKAGLLFSTALRSILRQDPDIILIGEIRDGETAKIAIESALTGHLVFSTIHTNDSASIPTRLIDMGIEPFLVASSLIGATAQRLVRKVCNYCKKPYKPDQEVLSNLSMQTSVELGEIPFYKGEGCDKCNNTGYKGRKAINEILPITHSIRKLIMRSASSREIAEQAKKEGMKTLLDDALAKAAEGITTIDEVLRVVSTIEGGE